MRKYTLLFFSCALLFIGLSLVKTPLVHAQSSFDYTDHLMDDSVFESSGTMSASSIQGFLQAEGSGLASFSDIENCGSTSGAHYSYYATYYSCGQTEPASKIIYDASQAYGINPQVILATLQKEQSLVTTPNPVASQYNYAMGYGCPDSGSCSYPGFFNQVDNATWQFRTDMDLGTGINWWGYTPASYVCGGATKYYSTALLAGNNVTFYDDSGTAYENFTLPNMSTATLYCYTPHVYNNPSGLYNLPKYGTVGDYYSGSYNFVYYFNLWFVAYSDAYYSQSNYPSLNPGQQATVWLEYQNDGYETWYDDNSISSAPPGSYPVHLATSHALNRASAFGPTWPNDARPDVNFSAVYNSDGTTLASNQDEAQPGQIVKFSFVVTAPAGLAAATYPEYFMPILEGTPTGVFNDPGTSLLITVNPVPGISYEGQSGYPTIPDGTSSNTTLSLVNSGSTPLYDDASISSAPPGSYPVHLATSNPLNSSSSFGSSWPSLTRAAYTFAAVYNSDGTTLASNQHIAQPGQIIKFSFNFTVPADYSAGTYNEYLQPILEGTSNGYFNNLGISWTITVPQSAVFSVVNNSPGLSLVSNQPSQVSLTVTNVGNSSASSNTILTTGSTSSLATSAWTSSSTIQTLPQSLTSGQSVNLTIPVLAPTSNNNTTANLGCSFMDGTTTIPVTSSCNTSITISAAVYSAATVSSPQATSLAPNQNSMVSFSYKNTGNQPWYDDNSISYATWRNALPTHLATTRVLNRDSGFDQGWPNDARPDVNFSAVYNSDGTTLASNQDEAQPGQIVKFSFVISPKSWIPLGTYNEYFQPIIEGFQTGDIGDTDSYVSITVLPATYVASYYGQSAYPTLSSNQQATVYFMYKNNGNQTWYDDNSISSAPPGSYPVHLATSHALNRASAFGPTWPNDARPDVNFSAVYNSDGTTLASNQDEAQPGQIVKFSFVVTAPAGLAAATYPEYFMPILEGTPTGVFNDPGTSMLVRVTN